MEWGGFAMPVCRRGIARLVVAVLLACLSVTIRPPCAGAADGDDLFQVLDVRVDETDQTATEARGKALAAGERRAWDVLVERFVDPQQKRPLPDFSQQEIGDAVKDFWVTEEKTSAVRYIATLNYNFRPDAVRRVLGSHGVRYTTAQSKPVLVLPVYVAGSETRTSAQANPWWDAWTGVRGRPLLPVRLPSADSVAQAQVGAEQILSGDRSRLADLAQRNGAEDVLVAVATPVVGDGGARQLKVSSVRQTASGPVPLGDHTFPVDGPDGETEAMRQAVVAVVADLDIAWRRGTAAPSKPSSRTTVLVPTGSLERWVSLWRRLVALPDVQKVSLLSVGRDDAHVMIVAPGNTDQLTAAMAKIGLGLHNDEGEWVVSDGVAPPGAGAVY